MSKPCQRPQQAEIQALRAHKRQQERALREQQRQAGLLPRTPPPLPNTCSTYASIAEEQQVREAAVSGQVRVLRREMTRPQFEANLRLLLAVMLSYT